MPEGRRRRACPATATTFIKRWSGSPRRPFQSWFRQKLESPVDVRYCEPPPDPLDAAPAPRPPARLMWVKVSRPIDPEADKGNIHQCLAAYISDGPLLSVALQPHGLQFPSTRLGAVASLDHSMWFHAPFRADEDARDMRSPRLVDSRGLILGPSIRMACSLRPSRRKASA